MPKIIVSHKKEYGTRWRPFKQDRRDIKRVIQDIWDNSIQGTISYEHLRQHYGYEPQCWCEYPQIRPVNPQKLNDHHGCIFDLDAYCEAKEKYILEEVKSLNETVYAGGISKKSEILPSKKDNWHPKPIKNANDIEEYLKIIILTIEGNNPNLTEVSKKMVEKYYLDLSRRSWGIVRTRSGK